jgi:hypothetical protein
LEEFSVPSNLSLETSLSFSLRWKESQEVAQLGLFYLLFASNQELETITKLSPFTSPGGGGAGGGGGGELL